MSGVTPRDPISEGWLQRHSAVDYLGRLEAQCPSCETTTTQDEYRVIMGRASGFGAPWFVQPFMRRTSTKGKLGTRSVWTICSRCGSMLPRDENAREYSVALHSPDGLIKRR